MQEISINKRNHGDRWIQVLQYSAFVLLLFGVKLYLIHRYANATPFMDQWDAEAVFLYQPYLEGTLRVADLFGLHNEHRILTTRLLSLILLKINGTWNPLLQMVVNAALHIFTIGFGVALMARVLGRQYVPLLLLFSLILFGVPYAWENTLAGFQSQFYFVLFFSIASQWLTVTQAPLSSRWWLGLFSAILAFFSLASGIFALGAAAFTCLVLYVLGQQKKHKQLIAIAILGGLFVLGAMQTPSIADHASLKAASLLQFLDVLQGVLGWPMSPKFFTAVIRQLPALIFVALMLYQRPAAEDRRWFLLSLVIWTIGQAASIAYGRAQVSLSSRYLDLFAIGILVNLACLISILQTLFGTRPVWQTASLGSWVILILLSLGIDARTHVFIELMQKNEMSITQEINTRNYLATGDFNYLKDKTAQEIPYPSAERLAMILASPNVQKILPSNVRKKSESMTVVNSSKLDNFTIQLLNNYLKLIIVGFGLIFIIISFKNAIKI